MANNFMANPLRSGLKNLGNSGYINCVLQCLVHIPEMETYFLNNDWTVHLALHPTQKERMARIGAVSTEFASVTRQLHFTFSERSIAIPNFKIAIGRHHPPFGSTEEQDSFEFLIILMDILHEELNKVEKKKQDSVSCIPNDGSNDFAAAAKTWAEFKESNSSIITDLFSGQMQTTVKCLACGRLNVTFEPYLSLVLPIPREDGIGHVNISQCFDMMTREEGLLYWNCTHCHSPNQGGEKIGAMKGTNIWRLPACLVIQFFRLYKESESGLWKKNLAKVNFPLDDLDLTSLVKRKGGDQTFRYRLQGVINHAGNDLGGGHMTAVCRNSASNKWIRFDDEKVSQINPEEVVTSAAYILFYIEIDV